MSSPSAPWLVVALLSLAQAGLAWATWGRARGSGTTYVFTPLVEVVPGGVPLDGVEAEALLADTRHRVDQREIQKAYGRLGSTLDLDTLLRGVEGLDAAGRPLTDAQRRRIGEVLEAASADHARLVEVQGRILDLEARIGLHVGRVLEALPPDVRARAAGSRP